MITMYACFAVLAILAMVFVCWPFLRSMQSSPNPSVNAERIRIYHQRQQELKQDLALERISQTSFEESLVELKRRLLNDLSPEQQLESRGNNRIFALTGGAALVVMAVVFYYFTGNQVQLSSWQQAMKDLPELGERAVMGKGEPLSANERQALLLGLRTRLAQEGDDKMAWLLLGRVAMSLNEYEMATQAFDKVLQFDADNVSAKLSYAQSLLMRGSESEMSKAGGLLSEVLQAQPDNLDAISMLGLIAYERKDWQEAKSAFELLLAQINEGDPRYGVIASRIDEISAKLGEQTSTQAPQASVKVSLNLAPGLEASIPQNGILFVFAKAASGPPMPLAVKRFEQFEFPLEVSLSDSDAMMQQLTLSQFDQVQVIARISVDGDVATASGELQGSSAAFAHSEQKEIELIIDTKIE